MNDGEKQNDSFANRRSKLQKSENMADRTGNDARCRTDGILYADDVGNLYRECQLWYIGCRNRNHYYRIQNL